VANSKATMVTKNNEQMKAVILMHLQG